MPDPGRRWLRQLSLVLALGWMGTLFFLSHQPRLNTPALFSGQDKLIHALAYGLLGVLLLAAQSARNGRYSWRQIGASIGIASLYGLSDELHQALVPGRSPELGDWLADRSDGTFDIDDGERFCMPGAD